MRRKLGTVLAWILATLASIALATSAVGSVRDEVTNQPSPLRASAATVAQTGAVEATSTATSTTAAPTTVAPTSPPSSTAVTATSEVPQNSTSSSTTTTTTTSSPATTAPPSTTTTTTAAPDSDYFETVQLVGGWVRLRVIGKDVFLAGTVPSPGFSFEIKEDGPESVVVEFESESHESKLHAEVSGGELVVETEEGGD